MILLYKLPAVRIHHLLSVLRARCLLCLHRTYWFRTSWNIQHHLQTYYLCCSLPIIPEKRKMENKKKLQYQVLFQVVVWHVENPALLPISLMLRRESRESRG